MKNFSKLFALLAIVSLTFSCVEDDDFGVPDTAPVAVELDGPVVTIQALKSAHEQLVLDRADDAGLDPDSRFDVEAIQAIRENTVLEFGDTDQYVEGYVISSDEGGNFFEELYVQNRPDMATAGMIVSIDVNPLFTKYDLGRQIFVDLENLAFGLENGVYTLGVKEGDQVEKIPASEQDNTIIRSPNVGRLIPTVVSLGDFDESLVGTLVQVQDVQFSRPDVVRDQGPKTYAGEDTDEFDGERQLISCANGASAVFSTSTFADFKSLDLPTGRGDVTAVLTKNFFGDTFNLSINSPEDVDLSNQDRCDPDFLVCNNSDAGTGDQTIFEQNFETIFAEAQLDDQGWTNVNVSGGDERYEDGNFSGNRYIQVNAFGQDDDPMIAWLVTPEIDLDDTSDEAFSFSIQANFDQGGLLEVFITNEYTGDPTTTNWSQLEANIPEGPTGGFASGFTDVDAIDISCVEGEEVNIAFKYTASDPAGTTTRYHIDNLLVTGNDDD
ncbi:DUF5689 domain-containing protein [Nonlabens ponticola]|uniref:DUF5689 domain-containing protein n=1 Tax=Nonlabens ponticola TaxID=2496866 RepID=A0A3S9MV26_9FLAO|nr:DUF5689 domain-containing protein [Nonlabens ponticola]AZQ43034.1 hypothetical protein EJ995_01855 [Nonlabens ponticola]